MATPTLEAITREEFDKQVGTNNGQWIVTIHLLIVSNLLNRETRETHEKNNKNEQTYKTKSENAWFSNL